MGWTKKQLIEQAYAELALAGHVFDLDADVLEIALKRLDTMMATWETKGISVGYLMPSSPDDSNLGDDAGLIDGAVEAVYLNLAIRLAPGRGKQLSVDTRTAAAQGYNVLLARAVRPEPQQLPAGVPLGAGNKPWRSGQPFTPAPGDTLDTAGTPITT